MRNDYHNQDVNLTITLKYGPLKRRFLQKNAPTQNERLGVLRNDLLRLRLPHPRGESVTFELDTGVVMFSWLAPRFGVLHKNLMKIYPTSESDRAEFKTMLQELSIDEITLDDESPPTAPTAKKKQYLNPYYKRPFNPDDPDISYTGTSYSTSYSKASTYNDNARPYKRAKVEPVEPSLSRKTRNGDRDSVASSRASSPPTQTVTKTTIPTQARVKHLLPPRPPPTPSVPPPPAPPPDDPPFRPMSRSATASSSIDPVLLASLTRAVATASASAGLQARPPPTRESSSWSTVPTATLNGQAPTEILVFGLKDRLVTLRRQMESVLEEEERIMVQLRRLGGGGADVDSGNGMNPAEDSIPVLRAKLKLKDMALDNERQLREEAEAVVRDVKRECKEPFIVPALVDAFVQISHLTTKVIGSGTGLSTGVHMGLGKSL